ncbi:hypothetical protein EVC37_25830 [Methylocaldum sp. BRCS4]|uniref:hypothetical protein n=1 Tax=unclassified Methylocaldum TaxID=2622260 RepID=UPI000A325AD1|nr:hypothetical protein [Methylocaldum sp. BRCS4]
MHILLLLAIIPFLVLIATLGFFVLMVIASAVVEFPLVLLVAVGLGVVIRRALPNLSKKRDTLCESM